jgi:hypothetical protein
MNNSEFDALWKLKFGDAKVPLEETEEFKNLCMGKHYDDFYLTNRSLKSSGVWYFGHDGGWTQKEGY